MHYRPYEEERAAAESMTDEELLEYFLFRIIETDEVWSLKAGSQWLIRNIDGQETQPLWPYKRYAEEAANAYWPDHTAVGDSVEYFLYQILNKLIVQNINVEIMPRKSAAGCLVSPQLLFSYLEGMKDSRDYTLDD